jgi:tRNA threonylcarbamoyladenosine biosynthesis protein TsaB
MALLLNIDTAIDKASICLARDGNVIDDATSTNQREQATWLHVAIEKMMHQNSILFSALNGVAVSNGPGSYTGLRIGLSAAKGFCYSLNIPLITLGTLDIMAAAANKIDNYLLCPMIDARRMEVYTALYDASLQTILAPTAMVIDSQSFFSYLENNKILFFGNGSNKVKDVITHSNAFFGEQEISAAEMVALAEEKFRNLEFANLAYAEPLYLKDFYSSSQSK